MGNTSAGDFLERMSKDYIDRNNLIKLIEQTIDNARLAESSPQYINGLKASIGLIRTLKSEY